MSGPLIGYQPADVFAALFGEDPLSALFTTFTFSSGAFHLQYLAPLLQRGCGDTLVLSDPRGYAQSLFESPAVQGIGTSYRLRQVQAQGAFHAKLVLVRTSTMMVVGVGSGNLTTSGLQTNAEVGALYTVAEPAILGQIDLLLARLRGMAAFHPGPFAPVGPISLTPTARLLTSLDAPIFDQLNFPNDVERIEIVSPFVDGQLEVLTWLRDLWPQASLRLRLDPGFGALSQSLLDLADDQTEILVPVEKDESDERRRPAVHGKLLCFVGPETALVVVGSANLSRPALLTKENVEAVVERQLPAADVAELLSVPGINWRPAQGTDRRSVSFATGSAASGVLLATLMLRQLHLQWRSTLANAGALKLWRRGECVGEVALPVVPVQAGLCLVELTISEEVRRAVDGPTVAELRLVDGSCYRGWIDVTDLLDIPPAAKRQLELLDEIADDPVACAADDVVRFIEWLQRSLSVTRTSAYHFSKQIKSPRLSLDETPVERRLLLETQPGSFDAPGNLLERLLNHQLDSAIRDLRFFHREQQGRFSARRSSAAAEGSDASTTDERSPPLIAKVLRELFGQATEEFQQAQSPRDLARLLAGLPTCIKGLAMAVEKWPLDLREDRLLVRYFHRVVIAALAPGLASSLGQRGALERLLPKTVGPFAGSPEFSYGVALLEAYLLLAFHGGEMRPEVLRDLHDVLSRIPPPTPTLLHTALAELLQLQTGSVSSLPDPCSLRDALQCVPGELAGLRRSREALRELLAVANQTKPDRARLEALTRCAVAGNPRKAELLADLLSHKRLQLAELAVDDEACPACCMIIPIAARSRLNDTTVVHRCHCGHLLVRALET